MMAFYDILKCLLILRLAAAYPIEKGTELEPPVAVLNCTDANSECKSTESDGTHNPIEQDYMLALIGGSFEVTGMMNLL